MDTKLIRAFGTEILSYRIRTARQKKRMQYEDFDKHLIRLDKEESDLLRKWHKRGWESLAPPVQQGWNRSFELRGDIARNKHAAFFEAILKKINTYQWSHKKDFKIKKRKRGRKTYVVIEQKLLEPKSCHFAKLNFADDEKQFFHIEYRVEKWCRDLQVRYVFNEPWRFVLRVRPNIIDKVRSRDNILEARISGIRNYLRTGDYSKRQMRLKTGTWKHPYWNPKKNEEKDTERNPLKNKSLQMCLDEFGKEDVGTS